LWSRKTEAMIDALAPQSLDIGTRPFLEGQCSGRVAINHPQEKLLLLKARMNTLPGKTLAEERTAHMDEFPRPVHSRMERRGRRLAYSADTGDPGDRIEPAVEGQNPRHVVSAHHRGVNSIPGGNFGVLHYEMACEGGVFHDKC